MSVFLFRVEAVKVSLLRFFSALKHSFYYSIKHSTLPRVESEEADLWPGCAASPV